MSQIQVESRLTGNDRFPTSEAVLLQCTEYRRLSCSSPATLQAEMRSDWNSDPEKSRWARYGGGELVICLSLYLPVPALNSTASDTRHLLPDPVKSRVRDRAIR